jgi:hypothetical protein
MEKLLIRVTSLGMLIYQKTVWVIKRTDAND